MHTRTCIKILKIERKIKILKSFSPTGKRIIFFPLFSKHFMVIDGGWQFRSGCFSLPYNDVDWDSTALNGILLGQGLLTYSLPAGSGPWSHWILSLQLLGFACAWACTGAEQQGDVPGHWKLRQCCCCFFCSLLPQAWAQLPVRGEMHWKWGAKNYTLAAVPSPNPTLPPPQGCSESIAFSWMRATPSQTGSGGLGQGEVTAG